MRDQHRPKQDLINDIVALRKQVSDLRDAMAARRRVEDALRHSEEQLRALVDGSPAGLCLFRSDGGFVTGNRCFARLLGYDTPAELLRAGEVMGVFINPDERARVVQCFREVEEFSGEIFFRSKNGSRYGSWAIGAARPEAGAIALAVLPELSAAWSAGMRSASDRYGA
jgi:PAS domain S-box-containing protein